ncbi:hypothetical protein QC761_507741 [Podospora bellae-mahoneyi]|uniref:Uncharacterized protein n=1 Tax=Podospora bellae-mahoneyi TaxID=2093777 RepID=A0ABR0FED7_9PEZI|nr:hypothetical protein QC761_507741 [Podospora bellae-mahoneyi]
MGPSVIPWTRTAQAAVTCDAHIVRTR